MPALPCPACGFVVIREGYGGYEICAICGWQDDPLQLANPSSDGGANSESLAEAQTAALRSLPLAVQEHLGSRRSSDWRPLLPDEIAWCEARRNVEHFHSQGVFDPAKVYWRRGLMASRRSVTPYLIASSYVFAALMPLALTHVPRGVGELIIILWLLIAYVSPWVAAIGLVVLPIEAEERKWCFAVLIGWLAFKAISNGRSGVIPEAWLLL